jgi:hypothetical protein
MNSRGSLKLWAFQLDGFWESKGNAMAAYYRATIDQFLRTPDAEVMLALTSGSSAQGFDLKPDQHDAWRKQCALLRESFASLERTLPHTGFWTVLFEYEIAGRRKRLDCVVLSDAGVLAIEFKVGASELQSEDRWQLCEYCWNLRDFHRESRGAPIAQILVATEAVEIIADLPLKFSDRGQVILDLIFCGNGTLRAAIEMAYHTMSERGIWTVDAAAWDASTSSPTPSVVDCARRLFEGHDVREISHAHADNTDQALECLREAVVGARRDRKHLICFVTGVPGAGKTLVGLNAAYRREMIEAAGGPVCFASGNQPLLDVLQAALVRNRTKESAERREVAHDVSTPVRNVHDFALTNLTEGTEAPPYQVVVFDEAQRVWSEKKLNDGLLKRQRRGKLTEAQIEEVQKHGRSEPELLLSVMERCEWCVVIALVGGGQEIHDGEAGLAEWGHALFGRTKQWDVWTPPQAISGAEATARQRLFVGAIPSFTISKSELHLSLAKRSYRAEKYADWVNRVIAADAEAARKLAAELSEYPVWLVRDLSRAKDLLRVYSRGELHSGLLASSGATRLRSDGIEVSPDFRNGIDWPNWYLCPPADIRSSNCLEVAATEFECQGLELDWCGVCWGGDFVMLPNCNEWQFRRVRMPARKLPKWYFEADEEKKEFVRNKYRVLLTRGRVGVVIFVPRGRDEDETLNPSILNSTADFLLKCGATLADNVLIR